MADPREANRHPSAAPYTDAHVIAERLRQVSERTARDAQRTVRRFGLLLEARVKANASGRPGPRAQTGDYRRSINSEVAGDGEVFTATVGTGAPQAARLEYGFVGADRLGRVYNQPPFPHFGPAVLATRPEFVEAMRRLGGEP